jgi:hypothetical protein
MRAELEHPSADFFARPVNVWVGDFFAVDTEPRQGETALERAEREEAQRQFRAEVIARKGLERPEPPDGPWFLPGGHYPEPDLDPDYAREAQKFRRELLERANPPASEPEPDLEPAANNPPSVWARIRKVWAIHGC